MTNAAIDNKEERGAAASNRDRPVSAFVRFLCSSLIAGKESMNYQRLSVLSETNWSYSRVPKGAASTLQEQFSLGFYVGLLPRVGATSGGR